MITKNQTHSWKMGFY